MSEDLPPAKRRRVGNTRPVERRVVTTDQSGAGILQLPDDVLMLILNNLSSPELIKLADTCLRFKSLCLETKSLWLDPDFSGHPMELKKMKECLNLFHGRTRSLTLEGLLRTKGQVMNLSEAYLRDISRVCPEIRSLRLQHFYVNAGKILFEHLPSFLTKLSLVGSEFHNLPEPYFKNIHTKLPNLEELDLTNCGWVTDYFLMAICKIEPLKVLSLRGCHNVGACFAYCALATRFGFNKIEKFDLRDTGIGDTELVCFGRKSSLKELLISGTKKDNVAMLPFTVTERGIENITAGGSSNIERLTLAQCDLSDSLLMTLASEMKRLTYLDVRGSANITTDGLKLFESRVESRPGASQFCEILY